MGFDVSAMKIPGWPSGLSRNGLPLGLSRKSDTNFRVTLGSSDIEILKASTVAFFSGVILLIKSVERC